LRGISCDPSRSRALRARTRSWRPPATGNTRTLAVTHASAVGPGDGIRTRMGPRTPLDQRTNDADGRLRRPPACRPGDVVSLVSRPRPHHRRDVEHLVRRHARALTAHCGNLRPGEDRARFEAVTESWSTSMHTFAPARARRHTRFNIITSRRTEFVDITDRVESFVRECGVDTGLVNIQSLHTTTAIVLNEHEPLLLSDFSTLLGRVAPRAAW